MHPLQPSLPPWHRDRNAASFTYHERQQAKQVSGTQSGVFGRESMKDFDACSLCLLRARDPRTCSDGHLYCHECIIANLLAQKNDIKRQSLLLERMRAESEAEMAAARAAARDRVLREFESTQSSLANSSSGKQSGTENNGDDGARVALRGTKRSFQLDEDEIERLTNQATDEALRKTTQEMADARKAKLPNYWLVRRRQPPLVHLCAPTSD